MMANPCPLSVVGDYAERKNLDYFGEQNINFSFLIFMCTCMCVSWCVCERERGFFYKLVKRIINEFFFYMWSTKKHFLNKYSEIKSWWYWSNPFTFHNCISILIKKKKKFQPLFFFLWNCFAPYVNFYYCFINKISYHVSCTLSM